VTSWEKYGDKAHRERRAYADAKTYLSRRAELVQP
jgi:hypothetical protein